MGYHIYPGRIKGMATSMGFCLAYLCWIMVIAYVGGIWVYPILKILDPVPRAAFMITCSLIGGVLYIVGEKFKDSGSSAQGCIHDNLLPNWRSVVHCWGKIE